MFVNFLMATNVFDMPASPFSRYLDFFDIETATPMQTWDRGTRRIRREMSAAFTDRICLDRLVRRVIRRRDQVVVEDEDGTTGTLDEVVFACNANQTLMILDEPTRLESWLLSSIRCESTLHNQTIKSEMEVGRPSSVIGGTRIQPRRMPSPHPDRHGALSWPPPSAAEKPASPTRCGA